MAQCDQTSFDRRATPLAVLLGERIDRGERVETVGEPVGVRLAAEREAHGCEATSPQDARSLRPRPGSRPRYGSRIALEPDSPDRLAAEIRWQGDADFTIDGLAYGCRPMAGIFSSSARRFCVRKPREVVLRYERLLARLKPRRIVEVGVYEGGSTALLAQLAAPEKLVAIDIEPSPHAALEQFIDANDLRDSVSVHWGVDQSDADRLTAITRAEIGPAPLDLVIDDASHLLEETTRTFETLFPLLRPGGEYVVEDWAWAHSSFPLWPNQQPLSLLVFQLIAASGFRPDVVEAVTVDRPWAVVRRGPAELSPDRFRVAEVAGARAAEMMAALESSSQGPNVKPRRRLGRTDRR